LVVGGLMSVLAALAVSAAPALAATGNAYKSQFTRPETGGRPFYPAALAFNASGDVFVFDAEHGVLDEFNPSGSGTPLVEFTGDGTSAESFYTEGIAVNAGGDLFVVDYERKVVYEFEPDGKLLREINGGKTKAGSFYPTGVAVNSTSGDLYVADYEHGVVDEFEPAAFESAPTGSPVKEFSTVSKPKPYHLAVDASSGDLYVAGYTEGGVAEVQEFEPDGTLLAFNGSGTPQGSSFYPIGVAVAPSGEVYVSDYLEATEHSVVDRFSSTGTYLSQFEGGATPQGSFGYIGALAVNASEEVYVADGAHHVVDVFSKPVPLPVVTTGAPSEEQQTTATLTGSIEPSGGLAVSCEFRYGAGLTAPCEPAGPFSSSLNAVEAKISGLTRETTYGYRLLGTTSEGATAGAEETFTTLSKVVSPPAVSIEPVTPIAQNSATFNGGVNPNEAETKYHFEYSSDGVNWTALKEESAGDGSSEVPVTQTVSGLTGHTTYYVRLVAENSCEHGVSGCGASTSTEETFSTLAGPPKVSGTGVTDITAGEATLHATIYPENQPATTYRFEYGPTAAYGTTVPVGEGHVVGSTPTQVSQVITGLSPDTTYHFRVVASNGVGSPKTTTDQTFTTSSSAQASTGCPNEQVRRESDVNPETGVPFSMQLPECRAYEMVSPALKNGAPISSTVAIGLSSGSSVARVGPEGSTVLIRSSGIWSGGEQPANNDLLATLASEGVQYRITRGESGWSFKPEDPPNLRTFHSVLLPSPADMSTIGVWAGAGLAPSETQIDPGASPNFYLLEPSGALAEIGPSVPLPDQDQRVFGGGAGSPGEAGGGVFVAGGSTDLSRVLFDVRGYRWSFDQTRLSQSFEGIPSLYEYAGTGHSGEGSDVPTLVGVDNTGALISQCGTDAAGHEGYGAGRSGGSGEAEPRSISAGGSTVFFTAVGVGSAECDGGTAPAVNQVFARVGEPGPGTGVGGATTVNVAGSIATACEASDSCNVTRPVTYQGASTDGSKVFFTSEQPLVSDDTDSTMNLYECGLPGDSGTPPARSGDVNPCPELVRVSVPLSGGGAEVQSVAAVSQEGSHVYFVAKGVLSGENAEHNSPTAGQDNLYVWEQPSSAHPQGRTAFIATLSAATFKLGEVETTPDGEQLVFTSSADLTADDTSTVSQVFLYEAEHEALIRISKGQDGFNDDGNTTTDPAYISSGGEFSTSYYAPGEGRRAISEDGSTVVFQSSAALTPQVHGGTRNVYLWRGGNVYLISDGTPAGNQAKGAVQAGLVGVDASGQNVFFTTEAQLVGQDKDELSDLYDARVDGGFPAPKVNECVGEACQGAPSAPPGPVMPGSLSPSGQGNLTPPLKSTPMPKAKPLTRAQKLAKALKACTKDKAKKKRAECRAAARKLYGAKHKAKKRKTSKSAGKRGKR
jgi:sugar lactone lactonase YvrE